MVKSSHWGMGQSQTTRILTAGFRPCQLRPPISGIPMSDPDPVAGVCIWMLPLFVVSQRTTTFCLGGPLQEDAPLI